jgi:predicted RNA-binding protein with EMAP domain
MIKIPVSVGELLDKLSILLIKKQKILNPEKLIFILKEIDLLQNLSYNYLEEKNVIELFNELLVVNEKLWDIEEKLRIYEYEENFNSEFIELARLVYFTNDKRFELKNSINSILNSEIKEVKEYVKYKKI